MLKKGFKNIISPFAEVMEMREWQLLDEHKESGCASLVKEFYANMVEKEEKKSICQRPMGRVQQRKDKQIVQSKYAKGWYKVQEMVKGTRTLENSKPTHGRKTANGEGQR